MIDNVIKKLVWSEESTIFSTASNILITDKYDTHVNIWWLPVYQHVYIRTCTKTENLYGVFPEE